MASALTEDLALRYMKFSGGITRLGRGLSSRIAPLDQIRDLLDASSELLALLRRDGHELDDVPFRKRLKSYDLRWDEQGDVTLLELFEDCFGR